jgi:hypothetical protein
VAAGVNRDREAVRQHREGLVAEHLSGPLARFLADAPLANGSPVERLQLVLQRVPADIQRLSAEC